MPKNLETALDMAITSPEVRLGKDLFLEYAVGSTDQVTPSTEILQRQLKRLSTLYSKPLPSNPPMNYGEVDSSNEYHVEFMEKHVKSIRKILLDLFEQESFIKIFEIE